MGRIRIGATLRIPAEGFSCIPRTIGLARRYRKRLRELMGSDNSAWPFEDQVLVWLSPRWLASTGAFHAGSGRAMQDEVPDDQLARIDMIHYKELRRRLGVVSAPRRKPYASQWS